MFKTLIGCVAIAAVVAGAGWAAWPALEGDVCHGLGENCCSGSSDSETDGSTEGATCSDQAPCCQAGATDCEGEVATAQTTAKKPATTVIDVEDLDCPSCAKKVVAKMKAVTGVARAEADVKTSKLRVTAAESVSPSPKAMWEAVEAAGFKPTRLEGPAGAFTVKPGA